MRATTAEEYRGSKTELGFVWLVYAVGGAAVVALVARPALVAAVLLAAAVALAAYRLPESLLVAFLVVGPVKETVLGERLSGLLPAGSDLTLLAAAGLVVAVAASLWLHRREDARAPLPAVFFLVLVVLVLLGVLTSPDPAAGLQKALAFQLLSGLAFAAPLVLVKTPASLYRLLALLVLVGMVVAVSAERSGRSESVLVLPGAENQIQVGLLLGLGVIAVAGYLWPASAGWRRLVWLPPAGLLLSTLVATGARSALVGTLLAALLAIVLLLSAGTRDRIAALALVAVLVALLPAAWVSTDAAVKERYLTTIADARGGAGLDSGGAARSDLAAAAVDVFAANPLGAGTGAYTALTGYEWPHNIVLELASELGVLGVAAFLALLAGIAVGLHRAFRRPRTRREAVAAASLLVLPLTMSLSSFDLNGNRLLWFSCGLALAVSQMSARPGT